MYLYAVVIYTCIFRLRLRRYIGNTVEMREIYVKQYPDDKNTEHTYGNTITSEEILHNATPTHIEPHTESFLFAMYTKPYLIVQWFNSFGPRELATSSISPATHPFLFVFSSFHLPVCSEIHVSRVKMFVPRPVFPSTTLQIGSVRFHSIDSCF